MAIVQSFYMSLDGHFIVDTNALELAEGWLTFFEDELPALPTPIMFTPGIDGTLGKTAVRKKSFMGIKYKSEVNFGGVFEKPNKKCLFVEEEKRVSIGERAQSKPEAAVRATYESKDAIALAREKVMERGDKLKNFERKMEDMSLRAQEFSKMAEELAK
jgi:hypothetical protein